MLARLICLCHDVTRVKTDKGNFLTGASQDELNLLEMTEKENLGVFIERDSDYFQIEIRGKREVWKNLKYYEFSSDTKMMSRVVQNKETGQILVLSKGADSAIIPRCIETNSEIETSLNNFANLGYRTLTFAYKELASFDVVDTLNQEETENKL